VEFAPNFFMTAKKTSQDNASHTTHVSPFEHILHLETQEEARLQNAMESLRLERIDAEKGMSDTEKIAEEKMREEAKKRLSQCKEEAFKEMEAHEITVKEDVKAIESSYKKHAPALIEEQAKALLSLNI